ncbi:MAG TPA: hypothetical protein VJ901_19400 [Thermoanaerobaculia bacterium]|nr:hypothetical protein [Thermoanaerobaculia bacterium]
MKTLAALLFAFIAIPAFASDFDKLVDGVIAEYGGAAAWKSVQSIDEKGTIASAMGGHGAMTRTWQRAHKLRVEIAYPDHTEVRDLDGDRGTHNGKAVTGMPLDAMTMQWARLAIPKLLIDERATLQDLGTKEGLRLIGIPLNSALVIMAAVDPKTNHIVRSASKGTGGGQTIEFVTEYTELRKSDGLLIAFHEENFAQGMKTGDTSITTAHVTK